MLGAIAGDIIGSIYEGRPIKSKDFELCNPRCTFTDDTVLSVAVADALLNGRDYVEALQDYFHAYPDAGFGAGFIEWAWSRMRTPYNSWGNGSAMRVSPVAFAFHTLDEVLDEARRSAEVTHNHPEGVRGAEATAGCVFLAWTGASKNEIRDFVQDRIGYDLSQTLDEIRPNYAPDISCQGSVPQSILAFLESKDFEDAVRNAISLGGDADTMANIAGAIAHAHHGGIPKGIRNWVMGILDERLRSVVESFNTQYGVP